jgi:K+-sensing histidine kinase KdpD
MPDKQNNRATPSEADKETIISLLLHDLKPPLQVLGFLTSHLADDKQQMDLQKIKGYHKELNYAVGELIQSSSAIFTWLEVQRKSFDTTPKPTSIDLLLKDAKQSFIKETANTSVVIEVPELTGIAAVINAPAIQIMLHQLLRNAAAQNKIGTIRLSASREAGAIQISVQDEGSGIDQRVVQNIQQHLIEPEAALPVLYRYGYRIIIQVLQLLHATISFNSTAQGGAIVTLLIPDGKGTL